MEVYSSYFAKAKQIDCMFDHIKINIAVKPPKNISGYEDWKFVQPDIFIAKLNMPLYLAYKKGLVSTEQYIQLYKSKLKHNSDIIKVNLDKLSELNKPIVFYCYEKSCDFCHRHILLEQLKLWNYEVKGEIM